MLDLRRLRYFLAVADELNFSRAAERLRIAQPALSRQIRQFESELGVELLRRTTHTVELTEAGRFVRDDGRELTRAADALFAAARRFGAGERGTITLGFGTSAGYETAPRLIESLREALVEIAIESRVMGTPEILEGIAAGTLDLGLVRCAPQSDGLEQTLIRRERQGVLLRAGDPLATQPAITLGAISDRVTLVHERDANPGHYDAILALHGRRQGDPRLLVRGLAADLTYAPIVDGRAVAIAGESVTGALPQALAWIPLTPPVAFDVSLIARRDQRSPLIASVREAADRAAAARGWLAAADDAATA